MSLQKLLLHQLLDWNVFFFFFLFSNMTWVLSPRPWSGWSTSTARRSLATVWSPLDCWFHTFFFSHGKHVFFCLIIRFDDINYESGRNSNFELRAAKRENRSTVMILNEAITVDLFFLRKVCCCFIASCDFMSQLKLVNERPHIM